jgi:hypothetical protein
MSQLQIPVLNGIPEYLYYGQNDRVEELNTRIIDRLNTSSALEPNFDPRPVPTKYALFPIVDRRSTVNEVIHTKPNYYVETHFHPGTGKGPVSGFSMDKETILRNQCFALQSDIGQSTFIPSSKSDLYRTTVISRPTTQPYPKLFESYRFDQQTHPNVANFPEIGRNTFFNGTRNQLRGINELQ